METLPYNDLLALNRAIGEICTARDMEAFYQSAFSAIQSVIPGVLCSYNEIVPRPLFFSKVIASSREHKNVSSKLLPVFNAHIDKHPLNPDFLSGDVFITSDRASRNRFKATAIYNEYYRHLDVETQMGVSITITPVKAALFALSKKVPDFSERDRLLLTLLKPHLINALRNATELDSLRLERALLQKGDEAERQGAVLFQSDGMILCLSPFAKELFSKYFGAILIEGDMLPVRLLTWLQTGNPPSKVERPVLTIEKEDRSLTVKLLNDFTTGDYILLLAETDPSGAMRNLQGYGLSCRETEVLLLLSKGKTNVEIAIILGTSKRTAEKHMENIFAKLGVETRAAAAAMMQH